MKNLTLLLVAALLLPSCKNIQKMVDQGNYDQAIEYAVDKLEGKKDKDTKYVKALEDAYIKVNKRDVQTIERLAVGTNIDRYDKIYDIYINMDQRQNTVMRLDPLVSKDGYIASLPYTNYTDKLVQTANKASETHYQEAERLIAIARNGDKLAARQAYQELGYIERYHDNYKNTDELYTRAYELGLDHIGVSVQINSSSHVQYALTDILYSFDITSLNDFWTIHHLNPNKNIPLDYLATISIEQIEPGFEREFYNTYQETKEVEDGKKPVKDLNGNTVKDTLGNIVYTKKYRTINATITELHREKSATIVGKTIITDLTTNSLVRTVPLTVTHIFDDYQATYNGDYNAISSKTRNRLKSNCSDFPSDYDMVMAMATNFRDSAYSVLQDR